MGSAHKFPTDQYTHWLVGVSGNMTGPAAAGYQWSHHSVACGRLSPWLMKTSFP